jgi:WD40 repeat protein
METHAHIENRPTAILILALLTTNAMAMSSFHDNAEGNDKKIAVCNPEPPNVAKTMTVCEKETHLSQETQQRRSRHQCLDEMLYNLLDTMPSELISIMTDYDSHELHGKCAVKVHVNATPNCLTILSNGQLAYASDQHRQITLLDRRTLQFITSDTPTKKRKNRSITYLGADRFAYPTENMIKIVTVGDKESSFVQAETKAYTRCFSTIQHGVFAASEVDGTIRLRDAQTGENTNTIPKYGKNFPSCLALLPNKQLIIGSYSGCIHSVHNIDSTPQYTAMRDQHKKSITCFAYLAEASQLASGSNDGVIKIWNLKTQECIRTLIGHKGCVSCLTPLSSGQIASGSDDGRVIVWDLETGKCTPLDLKAPVLSICQLPDGPLAIGVGDKVDNRSIQIWC